MKPSEMIRRGAAQVVEKDFTFLSRYRGAGNPRDTMCGCALGTMLVGASEQTAISAFYALLRSYKGAVTYISEECGIPTSLGEEIHRLHCFHGISRATIADWLEQAGY